MASITRVHPASTPTFPVSLGGSAEDIIFVEIDYLAAANATTGPESALTAVTNMLGTLGTIVYEGPLYDSNTKQLFALERCTTDTAVANFGTMTVIQAALRALGTVDSLNLSSATAIKGGPSEAKQDAIA